jgi:undecaprenyl-diphosphatase
MNAETLQPWLDWLSQHPALLLISIGLISFVESLAIAGIVVPGVLLLFLVAVAAGGTGLDPASALAAGVLGAVAGDGLSFWLGRHFKGSLRRMWPVSRYPQLVHSGEDFFQRHGGKSIFFGRFVGPIRAIIPLVAGMLNMNPGHFLLFNLASALLWAPFYILPGYLAGAMIHLDLPAGLYVYVGVAMVILGVLALLFVLGSRCLQPGSQLYDAIEIRKRHSTAFRRVWIALTRHHAPPREFPLASLSLFVLALLGFGLWTLLRFNLPALLALDQQVLHYAALLRNPITDPLLISLTMLGDEAFLYCSFAVMVLVSILLKRPIHAVHLVLAGLLTAAVTHGLKDYFSVLRPALVAAPPDSLAYPSGHASGSTVFYGLMASLIAQHLRHDTRWQIYLGFALPMALVALSRVMLGVHWLSDIVGGVLLGLSLCGLTRTLYSRWLEAGPARLPVRRVVAIGVVLWLLVASVYQVYHFETERLRYQVEASTLQPR